MARVLVVDDHKIIRDLVRLNLEMAGHEVLEAADGEQALEIVDADRPDILVCDLMMPGIGGLSVLRLLRANPETKKIPFVVLTAKTLPEDIRQATEMGADRYITKPFEPDEVINAVDELLNRS